MEAAAAKDAQPAKDECEFFVHTKHTCDGCFQQPILGKRYTSSVHSNFDLCARCFDVYSGPEIGLSEVVLSKSSQAGHAHVHFCLLCVMRNLIHPCALFFSVSDRDKKHSSAFVLKLKIDNGGDGEKG